jgi:cobalamin biosynthesis protein CobD/CbiB
MKLELTLPALERLIGGDTELEVALRRQIVEEFSRRHLKEVASTAIHASAIESAKQLVNAAAKEMFDVENVATSHLWPTVGYRFRSMIESLVRESAQKVVDETLLKVVEYQKTYWTEEVRRMVEKAVNRQIEEEVRDGIRKRLEAAQNGG